MCLSFNIFGTLKKSGELLILVRGNPDSSPKANLMAPLGYKSTMVKNALEGVKFSTVSMVESLRLQWPGWGRSIFLAERVIERKKRIS